MKRSWMAVNLIVVMVVMLLTPLSVSADPISPHENLERHEHEELFNQYDFVSPERVPDWLTENDPSILMYIYRTYPSPYFRGYWSHCRSERCS